MKYITYNPKLIPYARKLRKNSTLSEVLLWDQLKNKKLFGYVFTRQKPLLNFIVDFYCIELKLAIEIDGSSHDTKFDYDQKRQKELEDLGITFLRFDDIAVKKNMDEVLYAIEGWVNDNLE